MFTYFRRNQVAAGAMSVILTTVMIAANLVGCATDSGTGESQEGSPQFIEAVYDGSPASNGVRLSGTIRISDNLDLSGSLSGTMPNGDPVAVNVDQRQFAISLQNHTLDLAGQGMTNVTLDGEEMNFVDAHRGLPDAFTALAAVTEHPEMQQYLLESEAADAARAAAGEQEVERGWGCKIACGTAATALAALVVAAGLLCDGICVAGSVVTLGGLAIPCASIIAFCTGCAGLAAGVLWERCYQFLLGKWGDGNVAVADPVDAGTTVVVATTPTPDADAGAGDFASATPPEEPDSFDAGVPAI